MKNYVLPVLIATAVASLAGCRKDPLNNLSGDEGRIFITKHDDSVSFNSYNTFSIADSVAVISNDRLEEKAVTDVDLAYIDAVKAQMQQRGYSLVGKDQQPDLGITVSRIYNTTSGIFDYGGYWDSYYGSYWDPWYWGYPGYGYYFPPTYYGVYSITDGAISIDVFNLKDAHQNNNQIKGVWNGLIRGSGTFSTRTADGNVKALFDQSAYFKTTN
jgi:hypothetical protein